MQYKNSKKISFTAGSVKKEFSSEQLTSYSGLSVTSDFINHCGIYRRLEHLFPTTRHNASRFSTAQILSSILLASLCGVHRLKRIEKLSPHLMFRHGDETACQFVAPPGFKLHLKRRL
jgi:hypothetical protein